MRDYADEIYDEVRHFHGDSSVSIAGPNTAYEIRKAIDLYRQMTDEERDMILKVRDDYQALSDLVSSVKKRLEEEASLGD
jgi:hypothetical protein